MKEWPPIGKPGGGVISTFAAPAYSMLRGSEGFIARSLPWISAVGAGVQLLHNISTNKAKSIIAPGAGYIFGLSICMINFNAFHQSSSSHKQGSGLIKRGTYCRTPILSMFHLRRAYRCEWLML